MRRLVLVCPDCREEARLSRGWGSAFLKVCTSTAQIAALSADED